MKIYHYLFGFLFFLLSCNQIEQNKYTFALSLFNHPDKADSLIRISKYYDPEVSLIKIEQFHSIAMTSLSEFKKNGFKVDESLYTVFRIKSKFYLKYILTFKTKNNIHKTLTLMFVMEKYFNSKKEAYLYAKEDKDQDKWHLKSILPEFNP